MSTTTKLFSHPSLITSLNTVIEPNLTINCILEYAIHERFSEYLEKGSGGEIQNKEFSEVVDINRIFKRGFVKVTVTKYVKQGNNKVV